MTAHYIALEEAATAENFSERDYLAANPDVAAAVASGAFASGLQHFELCGRHERRRLHRTAQVAPVRARKMAKLRPFLREDLPHIWRGQKPDYLTDALRAETGIAETTNVSANGYDADAQSLIDALPEGLVLDCGAGKRSTYYEHVVNYEIVDYESTDVLGVAEVLPFHDATFDAVLSIAVLEHLRDPFRAAAEIVRVLKPGGKLICAVPLLQPLHGYPHHYYNMTHQGLRALFERSLQVDRQTVPDSTLPIWALTWIVQAWASGLQAEAREAFLDLRVRDLTASPEGFLDKAYVKSLPPEKNFELACGTVLFATKPSSR